jgi:hypothetical protein
MAFRLNTDPDPMGFDDQKWKKFTAGNWKIYNWIKNYNLPFPRPP